MVVCAVYNIDIINNHSILAVYTVSYTLVTLQVYADQVSIHKISALGRRVHILEGGLCYRIGHLQLEISISCHQYCIYLIFATHVLPDGTQAIRICTCLLNPFLPPDSSESEQRVAF